MKSWIKPPVKVEKRKLGPSPRKKTSEDLTKKPVYTTLEKQLHNNTKRDPTYFPPSWWLPGDK